jgi:hypothetical protein
VTQTVDPVYTLGVEAGDLRAEGQSPDGNHKPVIGFPPLAGTVMTPDPHPALPGIDLCHLMPDMNGDILFLGELLGRSGNQLFDVVDDPADVKGNPSGGIGNVVTFFEDGNLERLIPTAGP